MSSGATEPTGVTRAAGAAVRGTRAVLVATLVVAALCAPSRAVAAGPADDGKALFEKNCTSCHTIGGGVRVGPDLKGVTKQVDPEWVRRFIAAPDKMIAAGDPRATALVKQFNGIAMPNLGLAAGQVAAIVAYLEAQGGAAPAVPAGGATGGTKGKGTAAQPVRSNAEEGKNLFTGSIQLANGGPPCLSCHAIAGIGTLGGGALGPDLTGAYTKYGGDRGVASVLTALPFPTMKPIFAGHGLTQREQANLLAFLRAASNGQRPGNAVWRLVLLGVAVAVFGLALALVIWPRRRLVVRRRIAPTYTPTGEE